MTPEQRATIKTFQTQAPVDIAALANGLGLSVYNDYTLPAGISGMIKEDSSGESVSGYVISINGNEAYNRRRFTIAHECAHFLQHRDRIGDGIFDDAMYRSEKMNSKEEFEANNIAAELLMPRHLVEARVRQGFVSIDELSSHFQVSDAAMRVRMRYLYRMS